MSDELPTEGTSVDIEATDEALAYAVEVMAEIDRLAELTGSTKESVAQAFLAVRAECDTDESAFDILRDVARRNPRRTHNRIVVPGGTGLALPRHDSPLDGRPDPSAVAAVAEGRIRYHLDTLAALEADSYAEGEEEVASDEAATPVVGVVGSSAMSLLVLAACGGLLPVGTDRVKQTEARRRAREAARRPVPMPAHLDAKVGGCGAAGCTPLDKCLCTCRRCRANCAARKAG